MRRQKVRSWQQAVSASIDELTDHPLSTATDKGCLRAFADLKGERAGVLPARSAVLQIWPGL